DVSHWLLVLVFFVFFFFFQAEDGIRDKLVTGVQTCALPIWPPAMGRRQAHRHGSTLPQPPVQAWVATLMRPCSTVTRTVPSRSRSEERRVGKECRSRWWAENEKKKREQ